MLLARLVSACYIMIMTIMMNDNNTIVCSLYLFLFWNRITYLHLRFVCIRVRDLETVLGLVPTNDGNFRRTS